VKHLTQKPTEYLRLGKVTRYSPKNDLCSCRVPDQAELPSSVMRLHLRSMVAGRPGLRHSA
jgi:hypothetical protein